MLILYIDFVQINEAAGTDLSQVAESAPQTRPIGSGHQQTICGKKRGGEKKKTRITPKIFSLSSKSCVKKKARRGDI